MEIIPAATEEEKLDFREISTSEGLEEFLSFIRLLDPDLIAFLTPHTVESLKRIIDEGGKVFLNPHGAGYLITSYGDLQNVFSTGHSHSLGRYAVKSAVSNGAKTLDAFDFKNEDSKMSLVDYYSEFGFVETGRVSFDDNLAPAGWNYEKYGRPDVVFMSVEG